jgi:hypothetical protein
VRRRLALLLGATLLLLPACAHTDRPEGVVERWLISLNQGKAGRPERYAPDALSQRILPDWASKDPGELDVIEVGKGVVVPGLRSNPPRMTAGVPFRVRRLGGWSLTGIAVVERRINGAWRVDRIAPQEAAPALTVPSKGGRRIGGGSASLWLEALGVALLLVLLTMALMSTAGRIRPVRAKTT